MIDNARGLHLEKGWMGRYKYKTTKSQDGDNFMVRWQKSTKGKQTNSTDRPVSDHCDRLDADMSSSAHKKGSLLIQMLAILPYLKPRSQPPSTPSSALNKIG